MNCPKCDTKQVCGGSCCKEINKGKLTYRVDENNIICSGCGFTKDIRWWDDYEYNEILRKNKVRNLTELKEKEDKRRRQKEEEME